MKALAIFAGVMALGPGLLAGAQTVSLTPQSLRDWLVGNGPTSAQSGLAVPAGGQLARRFGTDQLTVALSARPVFGQNDKDLVTLEVGPAVLVFTRANHRGELAVVVDDNAPTMLPGSIKLGSDGSSTDPIEVEVSYDRSTGQGSVAVLGQVTQFTSSPSSRPIDVILTAGESDALPIERLEVLMGGPRTEAGPVLQNADENDISDPADLARLKSRQGSAVTLATGSSASASALSTSKATAGGNAALEIFTPPAVHFGRVDAVRSAVGQATKL